MTNTPTTTTRRARRTASVAAAVALATLLAACGSGAGTDTSSTASGSVAPTTVAGTGTPSGTGSGPTTEPGAPSSGGATNPTEDTTGAPTAGAGGSTTTGADAYPSAITDQVVANPAFDGLGRDITRRVTAAGLPGASLLVLHDGELVEQEAFGSYDLSTTVPIASASKWFAGVTIMSLVDDGLIDLDAPIRTYLPEADGPSGEITMRQLMAFTSGLEYDERIPCFQDKTMTLAQCNSIILDLPLLGKPGTGYRYTGTHLHVAAGVAEAVTGQTWEQIFQERVAQPLGMTRTTYVNALRAATPGIAPDGHPSPAGGAVSTLGDYGRFLEMLVHDGVAPDGTRILSSEAVAEMSEVQTGGSRFVSAAANRKKDKTPYGLAHWLDEVDADGNALLESSPGAFGFRPWIDSVNHIAGVYLIVDMSDEHVADSPDNVAGQKTDVQTSGEFVVTGTAKALGVTSPEGVKR